MASSSAHISYVELPAGELDTTKAFYTRLFGWDWVDYGPTYAAHVDAHVEVGLNALALPAPAHEPGAEDAIGPLVLFSTDAIDEVDGLIVPAGGQVVSPIYRYPGGRRFHFCDPSGNILGVYQPDPLD
jgi:uncharacterized protein